MIWWKISFRNHFLLPETNQRSKITELYVFVGFFRLIDNFCDMFDIFDYCGGRGFSHTSLNNLPFWVLHWILDWYLFDVYSFEMIVKYIFISFSFTTGKILRTNQQYTHIKYREFD